ncbi:MAG: acetoacetate--CoA ligase [Burkholderiaceae bacterium]|nr:acetoacetate--CoA ligase [Burkholderiaceae bacterium]
MPPLPEPRITHYQRWLRERHGLAFDDYESLWRWSVTELEAFWQSVWDYFDLQSPTPPGPVLDARRMPGARWFAGAQLNYAQQALRHADALQAAGHPAIVFADEPLLAAGRLREVSWPELRRQVAAFALALRRLGVQRGDRVCAVLPNTPETAAVFLACASLGAIWSVCSPDMGPVAVLDRFRQIEPKVLIASDGYRWGGQAHDRRAVLHELLDGLPSVQHLVLWSRLDAATQAADFAGPGRATHDLQALLAGEVLGDRLDEAAIAAFQPECLPFDHPLWVVYSSGTTGLPKPIVHGHGGVMLEGLKLTVLHNNVGPTLATGDRYHWYSTTGWIMWNSQIGGLLGGTTICIYDGNPAGSTPGQPDWGTLWRFAGLSRATFFGAGAAFYAGCDKAGVKPQQVADLSMLRAVGSTGSPLSEDSYRWIWRELPRPGGRDIWLTSISGGTDFAGAFIAGLPTLPVVAGEMQCRCLGAAVQAFSEDGRPLIDEVGELVCTEPMPSMPLYLWGDASGQRLHDSYFDMYPGIWRHGDWLRITPHPESGASGAVIYGRSDATINRHGVRMGTAELYRAVEALPEVLDSLVVDLEYLGRESWMPLFVVLRDGVMLDDALKARLKAEIRQALSPRHVPNEVFQVPAIPRTLSGKKMELPVKKLLMGADADAVMKRDAMANAACVDWFIELARARQHAAAGH